MEGPGPSYASQRTSFWVTEAEITQETTEVTDISFFHHVFFFFYFFIQYLRAGNTYGEASTTCVKETNGFVQQESKKVRRKTTCFGLANQSWSPSQEIINSSSPVLSFITCVEACQDVWRIPASPPYISTHFWRGIYSRGFCRVLSDWTVCYNERGCTGSQIQFNFTNEAN